MTENHDRLGGRPISTFAKARLLTLVCYAGAVSLVLHKNAYGHLSDRADTTALVVVTFSWFLLIALFSVLEQHARKTVSPAAERPTDDASRKRRILLIRLNQGWIALLVFALVYGLLHIPAGTPAWVVLVAVGISLFLMGVKIRQVRQIKRSLR